MRVNNPNSAGRNCPITAISQLLLIKASISYEIACEVIIEWHKLMLLYNARKYVSNKRKEKNS